MNDEPAVVPRRETDEPSWDRLVDGSNDAWLWHRFAIQEALATWPGRQDVSFAVAIGGELAAVMPVHVVRSRSTRLLGVTELESIAAPAFAAALPAPVRRRAAGAILAELERLGAVHRAVEVHTAIQPLTPSVRGAQAPRVNPLLEFGFEGMIGHSWVVDLMNSEDAIRQSYSTLARRELRKMLGAGGHIREAAGEEDLHTYYALHCETYARTGARRLPIDYFRHVFERFIPAGLCRVVFLLVDGDVLAAQSTGLYKGAALYWSGASRSDKLAGANRVLMDDQIMEARRRGCEWYETGEAFPAARSGKLKGLNDYKRSFGGGLVPFYRGRLVLKPRVLALLNLVRSL